MLTHADVCFHQSFFLWVRIDESHFLPPEKYLAPVGFLLLPLLLRAFALWYAATQREKFRLDELGLVLLANAAGVGVFFAHDYMGGGVYWQVATTCVCVCVCVCVCERMRP